MQGARKIQVKHDKDDDTDFLFCVTYIHINYKQDRYNVYFLFYNLMRFLACLMTSNNK